MEKTRIRQLKEVTSYGYENYKNNDNLAIRALIEAAFDEIEKTNHGRMDKETTIYLFKLYRTGNYGQMNVSDEEFNEILLSAINVMNYRY